MNFDLLNRGEPDRVNTGVVSHNFFDLLGIKPILGRTFVGRRTTSAGAEAVLILEPLLLAAEVRRRSDHRRPGVRDERPAAHASSACCPTCRTIRRRTTSTCRCWRARSAPPPSGSIAQNRARLRRAAASSAGCKPGAHARAGRQRRRRHLPARSPRTTRSVYRPTTRGFQATTLRRARALTERRARAAADPARHHRPGAADRLRQRRQPDAGADAAAAIASWPCARRSAPAAAGWSGSCSPRARCSPSPAASSASLFAWSTVDMLTTFVGRFTARTGEIAHRSGGAGFTLRRLGRHRPAVRHAAGAGSARRSRRRR